MILVSFTLHTYRKCLKMRNNYFTKSFLNALEHISVEVEKPTRGLKARWSVEAAKDLRVMHGMDNEEEIIKLAAGNLRDEIENQINQRYAKGYQGPLENDSGYVYAPYIPVMFS